MSNLLLNCNRKTLYCKAKKKEFLDDVLYLQTAVDYGKRIELPQQTRQPAEWAPSFTETSTTTLTHKTSNLHPPTVLPNWKLTILHTKRAPSSRFTESITMATG
jgi:hypothetical protein